MLIVVHLGGSIKSYRELSRHWTPDGCPGCGSSSLVLHDGYPHGSEPGDARPVWFVRFRCRRRGCGSVVSVLADLWLPRCGYPAATRDRAVAAYVSGQGTYEAIATEIGVAKSTVWRWVAAAVARAAAWLESICRWLRRLGEPDGPILFRHELRTLFLGRRVRRPGMLEGLLLVEALGGLAQRLRQVLLRHGHGPLAAGLFAFGVHVLDRLEAASASP